jgi:hypothetical protein
VEGLGILGHDADGLLVGAREKAGFARGDLEPELAAARERTLNERRGVVRDDVARSLVRGKEQVEARLAVLASA